MSIRDRIEVEAHRAKILFDANRRDDYDLVTKELKYNKVLLDPCTTAMYVNNMSIKAKINYDFCQLKLIDYLFEAGLIKDESNQECYDYEMPLESVRSFILNELIQLHGIVGKIVDDKDCVIRGNINNIHTNIDAYIKRMQKHIEEELLK